MERFDYAWKWFAYHADQRVKMFNYMLVVVGIFATAVASAYDKGMGDTAIALCAIAAVLALIFSRLDQRNQDLVRIGEDVLAELETSYFFKVDQPMETARRSEIVGTPPIPVRGLLIRERSRRPEHWQPLRSAWVGLRRLSRRKPTALWHSFRGSAKASSYAGFVGQHRFWLRGTAYLIALLFVVAGIMIARRPSGTHTESEPAKVRLVDHRIPI